MSRKHEFPRFRALGKPKMPRKPSVVGRRQMKNAKKCSSSADEMKNTAKTARRRPTKRRIAHFLRFPTLGKIKIAHFLRFPTLGKIKITHFLRFPTLGKIKITRFLRFPTLGKVKIAQKLCFPTLGKSKTPENSVSATAEEQQPPQGEFHKKENPNFALAG